MGLNKIGDKRGTAKTIFVAMLIISLLSITFVYAVKEIKFSENTPGEVGEAAHIFSPTYMFPQSSVIFKDRRMPTFAPAYD